MISIDIIAEFDFLENPVRVGKLDYERVKGNPIYLFSYDKDFLSAFPGIILSRDLGQFEGVQSCSGRIFSFLGDVLPDRWGRALIDKRERIVAKEKNRPPREFDDFDYMVHLDDFTRMGALRFYHKGVLVNTKIDKCVPVLTELKEILYQSQEYEKAVKENRIPQDSWVNNLFAQGSSLGGARPKANVIDNGILHIAKLPSINDTYDVALWEHFALTLAKKAGIRSAETRLIKLPTSDYHILLSKRFDRNGDKRIQYASSLTLTGLKDGDGQQTNKGYIDIVNTMISDINFNRPMVDIRELYRRIAFNILIGNHDDHFRNHGFLLTKNGWDLSPAFDINPTNSLTQSLMISRNSNNSDLTELLNASESYFLERGEAEEIISQVKDVVANWRETARKVGISENEQQRFASRIEMLIEIRPKQNISRKIVNKRKGRGM
ncbi:MAG: type II toxin-antitoxin system HipA family toxin [Bacteroidales bacterium]|nr:type II toxin-antitoxin system HipA family toxin [Bacteroidales bacterium]